MRKGLGYSVNHVIYNCYLAQFEPKKVKEALKDKNWVEPIHQELHQFVRNDVLELVLRPKDTHVIDTKWIFKNKTNEDGEVVRSKSRLVAQGCTQVEGVDFDESFAPIARLESIRILLFIACIMKFKLYQMDVKSAFLNRILNEEMFIPKGFQDPHFLDHVLRLKKALYGLKQAPRAWYDRLTTYLLDHGFKKGQADRTLFVKRDEKSLIVAQVYVDDIVFGSTIDHLAQEFSEEMKNEFEMSMVGELNYFLGLQVKQRKDGIFISQEKYAKNLIKKFDLDSKKHASTPMSSLAKLSLDPANVEVDPALYRSMIGNLLYLTVSRPNITFSVGVCAQFQAAPKESHLTVIQRIIRYVNGIFDYGIWNSKEDSNKCLAGYSDADWAECIDDRKSTSSDCFYLDNNLVSWISKKQNLVSLSMAEAEYIIAGSCYMQLLPMKKLLHDYGITQDTMCVLCDNTSAINLSKNPVQYSKSKHIEIRYHFIRDLVEDKIVWLEFINTDNQKVDVFTKPLDGP